MSSVDIAIGVVKGKVVAQWKDPIREIEFDPPNAYKIGLALSKAALDAHRGSGDVGKDTEFIAGELAQVKVEVSDQTRTYLINAVSTILRTFIEQGKTPGYMAMHCVDAVLRETAR